MLTLSVDLRSSQSLSASTIRCKKPSLHFNTAKKKRPLWTFTFSLTALGLLLIQSIDYDIFLRMQKRRLNLQGTLVRQL